MAARRIVGTKPQEIDAETAPPVLTAAVEESAVPRVTIESITPEEMRACGIANGVSDAVIIARVTALREARCAVIAVSP